MDSPKPPQHALSLILICALGMPTLAQSAPLNDTGMDWCGNNEAMHLDCPQATHPGQDAEFGRDLLAKQGKLAKKGGGQAGFDFTKLDQEGKPLPANAKEWSCVLDNHTGLMWEVKTTDGGLQDKGNTYTWYMSDSKINGGYAGFQDGGKCKGSRCDTEGYVETFNKQGLCGHNDWRLPRMEELRSIINYGRSFPAIDTDYFPNTPLRRAWAIETWSQRTQDAFAMNFQSGRGQFIWQNEPEVSIRLVRNTP